MERHRQGTSIPWFIPQVATAQVLEQAEARSLERRLGLLTWMARTQVLGSSFAAFAGALAESYIRKWTQVFLR